MSERDSLDGCVSSLIGVVLAVIMIVMLLNRLDRQENWIRDLQRRIATLEQERR